MANPIEYIVFEPDQVLTNEHLNKTFVYLDQQNRWTRNKLIGIGIVCGLDIVLKPGIIEITSGCGITSQGYLITQPTAQYTYYIAYAAIDVPPNLPFAYPGDLPFYKPFCADKKVWLLLTDAQFNALDKAAQLTATTISSSANFLLDYDVVLFLEAQETDLKNCDMQDCNNKGEKMAFQVRPLLVAKSALLPVTIISDEKITVTDIKQALPFQVELKRYNVPFVALNSTDDVLSAFIKLVDDYTLTQISNAYNYTYEKYRSLLKINTNPFTNLLALLIKYRQAIIVQDPVFIQYFYDFIDDLIKAWHEFSVKVSETIATCCPNENLFPLHLILGSASQATDAFIKDDLRNYFIYSPLFSKTGNDVAETRLFFRRMVIMVHEFAIQTEALQLKAPIRITPSQYEYPWLSQRAIPYYYKVDVAGSELYKQWNYYKTSHGNATLNLSYNANLYNSNPVVTQPLLFDIEHYNFFRVEGHIGQNYQTVLTNILNQRLNYNLPFDVVAISADLLKSNAALPTCNMLDLETDYKLIMSEAACKIHLVFCYISKLPYRVYARTSSTSTKKALTNVFEVPKTATLKFSTFKLEAEHLDLTLINLNQAYKKGDFMRKYCPPAANTIGSGYLNALNSSGVFTNPVQIDQGNSLTTVYNYFFEFINAVEELMYVLNTNTVAGIDMTAFNTKYQNYLADTTLAMGILIALTTKKSTNTGSAADTQFVTLAEDAGLDLLIDELSLLTNMCIEERLQVLKDEYIARLTQFQQQLTFLNYYKSHPGLEHKAGVPKGGTFVLVYHSVTQTTTFTGGVIDTFNNRIAANNDIALMEKQAATQQVIPASAYFDEKTITLINSFVNDCNDAPPAKKQKIIDIINRIPRRPQSFSIPDGAVIADFYIPYLCCSDCPPIAYIMPEPPPPVPDKPVLKMGTTFCDNDSNPANIDVSAPGGTLSIDGKQQAAVAFVPSTIGAGTFKVVYTLNNADSDPVIVTVLPTPVSTFTYGSTVQNNDGVFIIDASFTPDAQDASFTYLWQFGPGFSETESSEEFPKPTVQLDPASGTLVTTVSLTVSNGNCKQDTVTKNLAASANGLFEPGAAGKLLKGIENLFSKKSKKK